MDIGGIKQGAGEEEIKCRQADRDGERERRRGKYVQARVFDLSFQVRQSWTNP